MARLFENESSDADDGENNQLNNKQKEWRGKGKWKERERGEGDREGGRGHRICSVEAPECPPRKGLE